jgi:allophanate hydrolase
MPESSILSSLDIATLAQLYQAKDLSPHHLISSVLQRINAYPDSAVWIHLLSEAELYSQAEPLEKRRLQGEALPLYGIPFAVKDMIDVAGLPTTAGCPAFSYTAKRTASVVSRLLQAGALLVGKTNLDQFATGLAGDRTPYGACSNVFDAAYISGGSSSGSAVAVAAGLVSFALGTDTAGSGRVPAGCNNLVGLKPTPGQLSNDGVVPACRSLDCVSIFALTVDDALAVYDVARQASDTPSTEPSALGAAAFAGTGPAGESPIRGCTFITPQDDDLEFFGDLNQAALYRQAVERLQQMGAHRITVDFGPFREVAALLYDGPWVAERLAAMGEFLKSHGSEMHPVTRAILEGASRYTAVDAFKGQYRLKLLRESCLKALDHDAVLVLPTVPTIPTRAQVNADSIAWSRRLGYYTNFVNLLGLAAVVLPSGFTPHGLPASITLVGPGDSDRRLCKLGMAWQRELNLPLGATSRPLPETPERGAPSRFRPSPRVPRSAPGAAHPCVRVAVAGAHLRGQPLHPDLLRTGARFVRACRTAARYRFVALLDLNPPRPGLLRDDERAGAIKVEIYDLPVADFGTLVASVAPPLAIGTIELEDGEAVKGFLCESWAAAQARDITAFGGWVAFRAEVQTVPHPTTRGKPGVRSRRRSPGKENS